MADTLDDFIDDYPREGRVCSSTEALVGAALLKALRPYQRLLMSLGTTIIEVPDSSWLEETRRQVRQIWPGRPVEVAPDSSKISRDTTSAKWLKEMRSYISLGHRPVILTVDAAHLPTFVSAAPDLHIVVPPLELDTVIEAGRLVLTGQVRRYFGDLRVNGLDLDTLSACIARGTSAKLAAQRIRNALVPTRRPPGPDDTVPSIDSVAGFGRALPWAKNLIADVMDYRSGTLPWSEVDSAAILHGPPGTGKSLFARITANAAGVPLITISIAELFTSTDGHLDNVLKRLRAIFDEATDKAPCLLFIDEIDGLPRRGAGGENENYWRPLMNDLLMMLDSATRRRNGIVILAATNRIDDVDPALLRSQRLDRVLYIGPPGPHELARILRFYLNDDLPDVDLVSLVSARHGATGADAVSWAKNARRRARQARRIMTYDDIAAEVIGTETRAPATLRRVAIHEAGHVIAAYALGLPLDLVTLVAVGRTGGYTLIAPDGEGIKTRSQQEREVIVLLAGRAAEQAVLGNDHSTAAGGGEDSDIGQATRMVTDWHVSWGLSDGLLYRPRRETVIERDAALRQSVKEELDRLYGFAQGIMVTHFTSLVSITDELLLKRTLTADAIHLLLAPIFDPAG